MHALKERVSGKLSSLFSDSPSQDVDQHAQARPYSKEGKSWFSIFSFILPSLSSDKSKSIKLADDNKALQKHSFNWRNDTFSTLDKPLDRQTEYNQGDESKAAGNHQGENGFMRSSDIEAKEWLRTCLENGDPDSAKSYASCSENFEEESLERSTPNLSEESFFISPELYEFFESCLPNIVKGCQWVLLYCTARDGISLRTLLRKSGELSGPCLLITGDKQGATFGGLLDCPLKATPKRKYQGTNQTFLFTTLYGEPRLFRPTGANRYFYMCLNDLLAFGGGGNFALCFDGDLLIGTSGACDTFGNLCLAHNEEFEIKHIEVMLVRSSPMKSHCSAPLSIYIITCSSVILFNEEKDPFQILVL